MSNALSNRLIFVLSILGLIVTVFLAYEYAQTGPIVCPITGTGCDIVRKSQFSKLFNIDLPYYGLVFYSLVAALSVWLTNHRHKLLNLFRALVIFSGVYFGTYLTFLEAFVIQAYCIWCLISFIVSIIIFVICLYDLKEVKQETL